MRFHHQAAAPVLRRFEFQHQAAPTEQEEKKLLIQTNGKQLTNG
jgi:hypothetical protein